MNGKEGKRMTLEEIPVTTIHGESTTFGELADGRLALVVNVASRCGLSPQYEQLEALQKEYADRGFTVIGFPSNQFLQELSSEEAVAEYCSTTWGVTFPMAEKVRVNGRNAHPLYQELTATQRSIWPSSPRTDRACAVAVIFTERRSVDRCSRCR